MAKALLVPLQLRPDGTFAVTEDPSQIIRQRVLDLLVSSNFDRVMRPTYGCDLEGFLFTTVIDHLLAAKASEILNTINAALSFGEVVDVRLTPLMVGVESGVQVEAVYRVFEGGGVEMISEQIFTSSTEGT
jgi:phage baseplate assembly protein W